MTSPAYRRATRELDPADTVLDALDVAHPDLTAPVRVVNDRRDLVLDGVTYSALAFRARLAADVEGRAPRAEIAIDHVGRALTRWVDAAQGGSGATVRVMRVLAPRPPAVPAVEWEVTVDVLSVRVDQRQVVVALGFDPLLSRPAVTMRYDPQTAPGLF